MKVEYYNSKYKWHGYDNSVDKYYIISVKSITGNILIFYTPADNIINIKGIYLPCKSFTEADELIDKLLSVNNWEINEHYLGRCHKIKKLKEKIGNTK